MARIDLDGTVDMHSHHGPSTFDRIYDAYELSVLCAQAGMDAVVIKSQLLPDANVVHYVKRLLKENDELLLNGSLDIEVIGSVTLNYCNGGWNPFAVQRAIEYGGKVVWAPTMDAKCHGEARGGIGQHIGQSVGETPEYESVSGLYALDADGELLEDVRLCLDKVVENDIVFCMGHLYRDEFFRIAEYLADREYEKLVIDHPNAEIAGPGGLSLDDQQALVDLGGHLVFTYSGATKPNPKRSAQAVYSTLREIGLEHCIIASDSGQLGNPNAPDALRKMGELLLDQGLAPDEYRVLIEDVPKELLDLT